MDFMVWMIAGVVTTLLIPLALYFLPARTKIIIDTPTSTARAEMRLLWGFGPSIISRALPQQGNGSPLAVFGDAARIGHALMTPGIADAAYRAIRSIYDRKPRDVRVRLGVNLGDPAKNLVVQTGVQAAFAVAPTALRQSVVIEVCAHPGAEFAGTFDLDASPAQLNDIYGRFKASPAVREFRRRLKRKAKPDKRGRGNVQVS